MGQTADKTSAPKKNTKTPSRPARTTAAGVWATLLVVSLLSGTGCDSVADLSIRRLTIPASSDQSCGTPATTTTELPANTYTLRFTFKRRRDEVVGEHNLRAFEILCDRVVTASATDVRFAVPDSATVIEVEAFSTGGAEQLAFSGQRIGPALGTSTADTAERPSVFLHPAQARSCAYQQAQARAFHQATLLPNGEVLLTGGLVGTDSRPDLINEEAFARNDAEVFDPNTLTFNAVSGSMPARAFHRAHLLPSPAEGPYDVLLVGGVTASADAAIRLRQSQASLPFIFSPAPNSQVAETGLLRYTPSSGETKASLTYSPLPDLAAGLFPATALSQDGGTLLVAGGGTTFQTSGDAQGFDVSPPRNVQWLDITETARAPGEPPTAATLQAFESVRVGHSAAAVGSDSFLAIGGKMNGTDDEQATGALEKSELRRPFVTADVSATPTAWQTLTSIGRDDADRAAGEPIPALIWFGGRVTSVGDTPQFRYALDNFDEPAQLLRLANGRPQLSPASSLGASTAYHEATSLYDGSVLLTGGNRRESACELPAGSDPATTETDLCALDQVLRFQLTAGGSALTGSSFETALGIPRYGHRATRLLGQLILISGGITLDSAGMPRVLASSEVLSLRRGDPSEDYSLTEPQGRAPLQTLQDCTTP